MAIPATAVWETRTTGSDTANGGAFDPSNASMATDLAATVANTSAPVVTSASYNFVAGDVGAWVYIKSGTNWTAGWYQIASVAANAATLTAGAGAAVQAIGLPSTVIGCATVASPTGGTWSIDYSQQAPAQFTYIDLTAAGAGSVFTSAGHPFGVNQVGNAVVLTGGTNVTTGTFFIASVSGTTATFDRAVTTGASSNGAGGLGGAMASPGKVAGLVVAGNDVWIKSGTYTISSSTANIAGGRLNLNVAGVGDSNINRWEGFNSLRGDKGTKPVLQVKGDGSVTSITVVSLAAHRTHFENVEVDGNAQTTIKGFDNSAALAIRLIRCTARNCTAHGYDLAGGETILCRAIACTDRGFNLTGNHGAIFCSSEGNTGWGFVLAANTYCIGCISFGHTGANGQGFYLNNASECWCLNCTAYGCSQSGFYLNSTGLFNATLTNCLSVGNTGLGFNASNAQDDAVLYNCSSYGNGGGEVSTNITRTENYVTLTANPLVNGAGNNFSLTSAIGGGLAVRAAGMDGLFPGGSSTGYHDIGAVQHQDSGLTRRPR